MLPVRRAAESVVFQFVCYENLLNEATTHDDDRQQFGSIYEYYTPGHPTWRKKRRKWYVLALLYCRKG